jgi:hypothetical protein
MASVDIKARFRLTIGDITRLKVGCDCQRRKYFVARRRG